MNKAHIKLLKGTLARLADRQKRNVIVGEGDNR